MDHPKLYRKDSKGKLRVWWVEEDFEQGFQAMYRIWDGLAEGNPKASDWTKVSGKNLGKANETSSREQCEKEVKALYTKKLDRKYHRTTECNDPKPIFPMLAQTYKEWDEEWASGPIFVMSQPKLDGVRCIATKDGLQSREGQPLTLPHITEALKAFFSAFPDVKLDGELYLHEFNGDLGEIVSMLRHSDSRLQYHVYDMVSSEPFATRSQWLTILDRMTTLPIVRVQTHMVPSKLCLDSLYEKYISLGYEGQMIRMATSPYEEAKRSKFLLKRKEFKDAEFPLVRFEEGKGNYSGCAKIAICRLPDGREFGAGVKGKKAALRNILLQAKAGFYKDTAEVTVKFFSMTPDGVPRFPVVTAIWPEGRKV